MDSVELYPLRPLAPWLLQGNGWDLYSKGLPVSHHSSSMFPTSLFLSSQQEHRADSGKLPELALFGIGTAGLLAWSRDPYPMEAAAFPGQRQ